MVLLVIWYRLPLVVASGVISLLGVDIISERNGLIGPNAGHPVVAGQQKIHF